MFLELVMAHKGECYCHPAEKPVSFQHEATLYLIKPPIHLHEVSSEDLDLLMSNYSAVFLIYTQGPSHLWVTYLVKPWVLLDKLHLGSVLYH